MSRDRSDNGGVVKDRGRGRPPEEIHVLPPKLVPMTEEERKATVLALARLFLAWFEENGFPGEQE